MASPTPEDIAAGVPGGVNIVKRIAAPGGGEYLLGADGGVFAIGGAKYQGAYTGLAEADRQGTRSFTDIELGQNGGYTLKSDAGERYAFGTDYKTPDQAAQEASIYTNPAYMAFVRSADLGLEESARRVATRSNAINQALGNNTAEMGEQNRQSQRGINNSYEARGVYKSGARQVANDEQNARYATALGKAESEAASQVSDLHTSFADQVSGIQRDAGERGFDVAQTQDVEQRLAATRRKFPEYFAEQKL